MPLPLPTSSETTIRTRASETLIRSPAKSFGSVAGTISLLIREPSGGRNARAVSAWSASTDLAPAIVFSRIGQVVPDAMKATSDWGAGLKTTGNTVTEATGGIG